MRTKNFKKQDILEAIKDSKGSMAVVARNLTKITKIYCCRNTADRNVKRFEETMRAMEDEVQSMGDFIEMKGFELVNKGDGAMIRYYLSTKYRDRGYDLNEQPEKTVPETVDSIRIIDLAETPEDASEPSEEDEESSDADR